jgi:hypothetical protein
MSATILGRLATSGSPGAISAPARCLEGTLEVRRNADLQTVKRQPEGWGGRLELLQDRTVGGIGRIPEDGHTRETRHDPREEFEPLPGELGAHHGHARDVAARTREAGDESSRDRIGGDAPHDDRYRASRILGGEARRGAGS